MKHLALPHWRNWILGSTSHPGNYDRCSHTLHDLRQHLPRRRGSFWCVLSCYPGKIGRVTHTPQVCHDYKVKPAPNLHTIFSCELSVRGDIMRDPRHSHTPSISGHTARYLSSTSHVRQWCWHNVSDLVSSFAHHRITIPPSGWVTAAHRQGVKILGTM